MSAKHAVIIVPGLGNGDEKVRKLTSHWRGYGLEPIVFTSNWHNDEKFPAKLERLLKLVDTTIEKGDKVSLIGISAGASAAFNAFLERKNLIDSIVNIAGRLRTGKYKGWIKSTGKRSPSFIESLKLLETRENSFTNKDREKILTVRAKIWDNLVPSDSLVLSGAKNVTVPTVLHIWTIFRALTKPSPVIEFLNRN